MNGITWDKESPMKRKKRPGVVEQMRMYDSIVPREEQYGRQPGYIAEHLDPSKMSEGEYIMGMLAHFKKMRAARENAEKVNKDIAQNKQREIA